MTSKHSFENFFFCFCLFGIHPRNPFCASKRSYVRFLSTIPRVVHLICIILFVYLLRRDVLKNTRVLSLYYFSGLIALIPNAIFFFGTLTSANQVEDILIKLEQTTDHLKRFLKVPVNLENLEHLIHIKLFCAVVICVPYFIKVFITSTVLSTALDCCAYIVIACKSCIILLVITLIDYMNFLTYSLNQHLEEVRLVHPQIDASVWDLIHFLKRIRTVHFKLHKVAFMINSRFGWFLIAVLFDVFCLINNSVFLIFKALIDSNVDIGIMRNLSFYFYIIVYSF